MSFYIGNISYNTLDPCVIQRKLHLHVDNHEVV